MKNNKNIVLRGHAASPGLIKGSIHIMKNSFEIVEIYDITDINGEIDRFKKAIQEVKNDLIETKNKVADKIGSEYNEIFEAQVLALEDPIVFEKTISEIQNTKKNADYIYNTIVNDIINSMSQIDDDYLKDRIYDINDILNRVLRKLKRKEEKKLQFQDPVIIVAYNLTPTDLVNIDKKQISGIITETGGITSHFAIMARALNIPAVVGVNDLFSQIHKEDKVIVDGYSGIVIVDPDETSLKIFRKKLREYNKFKKELKQLVKQEAITLDDRSIEVSANIEIIEEVKEIKKYGGKGIGLLRTEFLFLNKQRIPTLEEQTQFYSDIAKKVYPDSVIIRTVDIGGDKPIFVNKKEDNPFLGFRGIRSSLEFQEVFELQLEAILRASAKGNIKIMLPIVSQIEEVIKSKEILEKVKDKLKKQKIKFDNKIDLGIMVEVPSCALMADEFAKYVDFFSIGTNDLTQYTLAVDRTNSKVSNLYDHLNPAVLKLIDMTVKSAHDNNIWVGLCGEMASDPIAVPILIGMELDELSVSPIFIPEVKKIIREMTYEECKQISNEVLSMKTAEHVRNYMKETILERIPNMKKYVEE